MVTRKSFLGLSPAIATDINANIVTQGPTPNKQAEVVPTKSPRSMFSRNRLHTSSLALDYSKIAANMVRYDKKNCLFRPIWIALNQAVESTCTLGDVGAAHVHDLAASISGTETF